MKTILTALLGLVLVAALMVAFEDVTESAKLTVWTTEATTVRQLNGPVAITMDAYTHDKSPTDTVLSAAIHQEESKQTASLGIGAHRQDRERCDVKTLVSTVSHPEGTVRSPTKNDHIRIY